MTRWQPYPEYKDSGVEWLEEIPAHWEARRLKYAAAINTGTLPENMEPDFGLQYVDIGNVDSTGNILDVQEMPFERAPSRARRQVRHGDTIISTVRTYLKAIAYIDHPPDNLIVSTGFAVLRPRPELEPRYLWRLVQSQGFVDAVVAHSEGIGYPAIAPTKLTELPVWIPSIPEQRAIAAFLDRQTARLDALIAEQRRLIELLQERRAALISRAVTRGVPPGATHFQSASHLKMKDSGIPWLGEIPEHWEVIPIKYLARLKSGDSITALDISEDGPYLVYGGNGVRGFTSAFTHEGDFVLIGRQGALCGNINYAHGKFWASEHAVVAHPLRRYSVFWFGELLRTMNLNQYSISAAQPGLAVDKIQNLRIPLPSFSEQRAIAAYLDRETAKIDAAVAEIETSITRLEEYRTALISAAVTGKIDVRTVATLQRIWKKTN